MVSHALKTWKKESINCLECCEKRFMEEWIIKLYSKKNCGQMPDIKGGVIVYFQFVKSFLLIHA